MKTYDEQDRELQNQVKYDFAKLFCPLNYLLKVKSELRQNYLQDLHEQIISVNDCGVLLEQLDDIILEQEKKEN